MKLNFSLEIKASGFLGNPTKVKILLKFITSQKYARTLISQWAIYYSFIVERWWELERRRLILSSERFSNLLWDRNALDVAEDFFIEKSLLNMICTLHSAHRQNSRHSVSKRKCFYCKIYYIRNDKRRAERVLLSLWTNIEGLFSTQVAIVFCDLYTSIPLSDYQL